MRMIITTVTSLSNAAVCYSSQVPKFAFTAPDGRPLMTEAIFYPHIGCSEQYLTNDNDTIFIFSIIFVAVRRLTTEGKQRRHNTKSFILWRHKITPPPNKKLNSYPKDWPQSILFSLHPIIGMPSHHRQREMRGGINTFSNKMWRGLLLKDTQLSDCEYNV